MEKDFWGCVDLLKPFVVKVRKLLKDKQTDRQHKAKSKNHQQSHNVQNREKVIDFILTKRTSHGDNEMKVNFFSSKETFLRAVNFLFHPYRLMML